MLKKIITILSLFIFFISYTQAEKSKFSLEEVKILNNKKIELIFSHQLKKQENLEESFKVTEELSNDEILVEKANINDNKVEINFFEELKPNTKYKVLVLDILDKDWNTIEKWYDASLSFKTKSLNQEKEKTSSWSIENSWENNIEKQAIKQEKEKNDTNTSKINKNTSSWSIENSWENNIEKQKIEQEEEIKKRQQEIKNKIKEKYKRIIAPSSSVLSSEEYEKIKKTEKLENSENTNNSWKTIVVNDLPKAWMSENILIIFSFFLTMIFFIRKKFN